MGYLNLEPGMRLANRYELIRFLGQGGFGRVFLAHDLMLEIDCALKLLEPHLIEDEIQVARFKREILLGRKIRHENACQIFDFGEHLDAKFISMEFVDGCSLSERLAAGPPLTLAETLQISQQTCDALAVAHRHGIVHRDLKLENVMLDQQGNAKVMDFGIAQSSDYGTLTSAKRIIGSPTYMAPERWMGREVDARSDVYSLGVLMYILVSGKRPFETTDLMTLCNLHVNELPPSILERSPEVPQELAQIIDTCLAKDPEQRYPDAGYLGDAIAAVIDGLRAPKLPTSPRLDPIEVETQEVPRPEPRPEPRSLAWVVGLVAASVLVFLAAGIGFLMMSPEVVEVAEVVETEATPLPAEAPVPDFIPQVIAAETVATPASTQSQPGASPVDPGSNPTELLPATDTASLVSTEPDPALEAARAEAAELAKEVAAARAELEAAREAAEQARRQREEDRKVQDQELVRQREELDAQRKKAEAEAEKKLEELRKAEQKQEAQNKAEQERLERQRAELQARNAAKPETAPVQKPTPAKPEPAVPADAKQRQTEFIALMEKADLLEAAKNFGEAIETLKRAQKLADTPKARKGIEQRIGIIQREIAARAQMAPPPLAAQSGSSTAAADPASSGTVRFLVRPWAQVKVDGKPVGTTPLAPLALAPGAHEVILENAELDARVRRAIEVQEGETLLVQENLTLGWLEVQPPEPAQASWRLLPDGKQQTLGATPAKVQVQAGQDIELTLESGGKTHRFQVRVPGGGKLTFKKSLAAP